MSFGDLHDLAAWIVRIDERHGGTVVRQMEAGGTFYVESVGEAALFMVDLSGVDVASSRV